MDEAQLVLDLLEYWETDTAFLSHHDLMHPAFQIIRKMATHDKELVISLILKYIEDHESWAFVVLETIVSPYEGPVIGEDARKVEDGFMKTDFNKMRQLWIEWGKTYGKESG